MKNKKQKQLIFGNPEKKYLKISEDLICKDMSGDEKLMHVVLLMCAEKKTKIHPSQQEMVKSWEQEFGRTVNEIRRDLQGLEKVGLIRLSRDRKTIHFLEGDAPPLAISRMI